MQTSVQMNPVTPSEVFVESNTNNPEVAWWCRVLVKVAAAVAGGVCFITGIFSCISLSLLGILAGIIQVLLSVIVLIFEVPICCAYFKLTQPISNFAERRTFMQKAFIFSGLAIVPVAMAFSWSTMVGCGLVFAVGVIYGLMALGKKADRETMRARAGMDDTRAIVPNIELEPKR